MINSTECYSELPQVIDKADIAEVFREGCLGIRLKEMPSLEIHCEDERGNPLTMSVEGGRIYRVSYLNMSREIGLFDIDSENSVVFQINEDIWEYVSTYFN